MMLVTGCVAAAADVVPMNIALDPTYQNSYRVPAGKVLLIHHVFRTDTNTEVLCEVPSTTNGPVWSFSIVTAGSGTHAAFSPPLAIASPNSMLMNPIAGRVAIYGYLVDQTDLYAALGSRISGAEYAANMFNLTIDTFSPRPAIVRFDTSSNLISWQEIAGVNIRKAGSAQYEALLSGDMGTGFYRARARARE
jgi:hypothetical protein